MSRTDLTPRNYHTRSQARLALRVWLLAVGVCALLAIIPISIETSRQPDRSVALARERMAQAQTRLVQSQSTAKVVAEKLKQKQRVLQAQAYLTEQPDWSELINRVAGQFDANVMMVGFRLGKLSDGKVRSSLGELGKDAPQDSVWLVLSGVAQSNSDVPGLILRLEQLGLFERVVMTRTERESFGGARRTGFVLACRVQ